MYLPKVISRIEELQESVIKLVGNKKGKTSLTPDSGERYICFFPMGLHFTGIAVAFSVISKKRLSQWLLIVPIIHAKADLRIKLQRPKSVRKVFPQDGPNNSLQIKSDCGTIQLYTELIYLFNSQSRSDFKNT